MSIEGVWTGELFGPCGWENSGVYVLEAGRILGGNSRHYSIGRYSVTGDSYKADVAVQYYGTPRAIFGEERERFEIGVKGKVKEGVIDAEITRADRPQFATMYRLTKRMDLSRTEPEAAMSGAAAISRIFRE